MSLSSHLSKSYGIAWQHLPKSGEKLFPWRKYTTGSSTFRTRPKLDRLETISDKSNTFAPSIATSNKTVKSFRRQEPDPIIKDIENVQNDSTKYKNLDSNKITQRPSLTSRSRSSSWSTRLEQKNKELTQGPAVPLDRPFTLPSGQFKPKQSLGQNFLSDQNYVNKICDAFSDSSKEGHRVIEVGPGAGALTRVLFPRYPLMTAIELDQRAVAFLGKKLPDLKVLHTDVLTVNWAALAAEREGPVSIIANLPYYIVSQVLFSFADCSRAISKAVVTMQWEVAERITAKPRTKDYGIPSVVFQLYCKPELNFKIPPSVFYPQPAVDSALVTLDFSKPHPELQRIKVDKLRLVLSTAFQQRRKMLRASLKDLLKADGLTLPESWAELRPDALSPVQWIHLVVDLYGEVTKEEREMNEHARSQVDATHEKRYAGQIIWRKNISPTAKVNMIALNDITP